MPRKPLVVVDEDEEVGEHAPFGDTFATRSDYSMGMMYAGRRKFMNDDSDDPLRPPAEFMTRKQSLRNAILSKGDKLQNLSNMAYFRGEQEQNNIAQANKRKLMSKKKVIATEITIETFSSTDPADWEEEFLAGCRMWTNHSTGEVSEVCPWAGAGEDESNSSSSGSGARSGKGIGYSGQAGYDEEGTGAPVYDGTELSQLFEMLDAYKSPKGTPAKGGLARADEK
jgi:hypothetical protein